LLTYHSVLIAESAHCAGATEVAVIQGDFTPAAVPVREAIWLFSPTVLVLLRRRRKSRR
jgi:hypothetical protein